MYDGLVVRNEEVDPRAKAYWVYRNIELALERQAASRGRTVTSDLGFGEGRRLHPGTLYKSLQTVVALGIEAHSRLENVAKTTVLYLGPTGRREKGRDPSRILSSHCRAETHSKLVTLGRRAHRFATLLWPERALNFEVPPIDLSEDRSGRPGSPRVTIFNHSSDPHIGARVLTSVLLDESLSVDCYGFTPDIDSNRVRYLNDEDVAEAPGDIHIHIGQHARSCDRLRVCDSWQSGVPVLLVDAPVTPSRDRGPLGIKPDYNVLLCSNGEECSDALELLLGNPALYTLVAKNGRESSRGFSPSWADVASAIAS